MHPYICHIFACRLLKLERITDPPPTNLTCVMRTLAFDLWPRVICENQLAVRAGHDIDEHMAVFFCTRLSQSIAFCIPNEHFILLKIQSFVLVFF